MAWPTIAGFFDGFRGRRPAPWSVDGRPTPSCRRWSARTPTARSYNKVVQGREPAKSSIKVERCLGEGVVENAVIAALAGGLGAAGGAAGPTLGAHRLARQMSTAMKPEIKKIKARRMLASQRPDDDFRAVDLIDPGRQAAT